MSQVFRALIPKDGKGVEAAIEAELQAFDSFFASLPSNVVGMVPLERNLLKSYLVWQVSGRPARHGEEAPAVPSG